MLMISGAVASIKKPSNGHIANQSASLSEKDTNCTYCIHVMDVSLRQLISVQSKFLKKAENAFW